VTAAALPLSLAGVTDSVCARMISARLLAVAALMLPLAGAGCSAVRIDAPTAPGGGLYLADGFMVLEQGMSLAEAHRGALADACRNALSQSCVVVRAETSVRGLRIADATVSSESFGYVQELRVMDAGLLPGTQPTTYHVRVQARVVPLSSPARVGLSHPTDPDAWRPVLRILSHSTLPDSQGHDLLQRLSDALRRCGMEVAAAGDNSRVALEVHVTLLQPADADEAVLRWRSLPYGGQAVEGRRVVRKAEDVDRVAIELAQLAARLWMAPRLTDITFQGVSSPTKKRLRQALGSGATLLADEEAVLAFCMLTAGDPDRMVRDLLAEHGLDLELMSEKQSLTSLSYRLDRGAEQRAQSVP